MNALLELRKYIPFVERFHPTTRGNPHGLFFHGAASRWRPEVYRHFERLGTRYSPPEAPLLLLLPASRERPFTRFGWIAELLRRVVERGLLGKVHMVVYGTPFGVMPLELDGIYPLSQYECSRLLAEECSRELAAEVLWYLTRFSDRYRAALLVADPATRGVAEIVRAKLYRVPIPVFILGLDRPCADDVLAYLEPVISRYSS